MFMTHDTRGNNLEQEQELNIETLKRVLQHIVKHLDTL